MKARPGSGTRWAFVALVLLVGAVAMAQTPPATNVVDSKCYTCHRQGGQAATSAISSVFSLQPPEQLTLKPGEASPLVVVFRNDWTSRLDRIAATLDLSQAPAFAFASPPDPLLGMTRRETLVFLPTALVEGERSARVQLDAPEGATALRFSLIPDQGSGPTAPDLVMRLWDPHGNLNRDAQTEVDAVGQGGTEVFRLKTAELVASRGTGRWTVEAAQRGVTSSPDASLLQDQGFRVVLDAWFNQTGDRTHTLTSAARLDGKETDFPTTPLRWDLFVVGQITSGQRLIIDAEATSYYQHPPQFGAVDEWRFKDQLRIPIEVPVEVNQTTPPVVNLNVTAPSTNPAATGFVVTMAAVGEAVGYAAAFLYVSSTVSGGMFGMRRGLNRAFRSARRRIAFHNALSYLLMLAATVHIVLFLIETTFHWSVGLLWGGVASLALLGLGFTGALQIPMIRGIGYTAWRVLHYGLALVAILTTLVHMGLDGIHFEFIQRELGWEDPLVKLWGPGRA